MSPTPTRLEAMLVGTTEPDPGSVNDREWIKVFFSLLEKADFGISFIILDTGNYFLSDPVPIELFKIYIFIKEI